MRIEDVLPEMRIEIGVDTFAFDIYFLMLTVNTSGDIIGAGIIDKCQKALLEMRCGIV